VWKVAFEFSAIPQVDLRIRGTLHLHDPVDDVQVVLVAFQCVGGDLQRLRSGHKGPAHHSTPSGRTVYRRSDLDAWRATQFVATIIYAPIEVCERLPVAA